MCGVCIPLTCLQFVLCNFHGQNQHFHQIKVNKMESKVLKLLYYLTHQQDGMGVVYVYANNNTKYYCI